jgi:hypothetical protein
MIGIYRSRFWARNVVQATQESYIMPSPVLSRSPWHAVLPGGWDGYCRVAVGFDAHPRQHLPDCSEQKGEVWKPRIVRSLSP